MPELPSILATGALCDARISHILTTESSPIVKCVNTSSSNTHTQCEHLTCRRYPVWYERIEFSVSNGPIVSIVCTPHHTIVAVGGYTSIDYKQFSIIATKHNQWLSVIGRPACTVQWCFSCINAWNRRLLLQCIPHRQLIHGGCQKLAWCMNRRIHVLWRVIGRKLCWFDVWIGNVRWRVSGNLMCVCVSMHCI